MENRPKITVNVGLTVPPPQPGNEGTGLTHTPNTPEILAMMAENMASAEVEGPSRAGGNCGVVGSSGPFVFRPQAPAAASITSIAADLSRSSDQLSLPTISIADMDDIKREVSISPVSSVSSSLTTLSTMTPVSQQQPGLVTNSIIIFEFLLSRFLNQLCVFNKYTIARVFLDGVLDPPCLARHN